MYAVDFSAHCNSLLFALNTIHFQVSLSTTGQLVHEMCCSDFMDEIRLIQFCSAHLVIHVICPHCGPSLMLT